MERSPNGSRTIVGVVVLGAGRLGVRTGRFVLRPARAALRGPIVRAPEAARAADLVLAGPLPEAIGRSLAEHRIVERVVAEMLSSRDLERAIVSALESERTAGLVEQVLASPALERLLTEALESRLTAELAERMVASPEFDRMLERAVSSPAVRAALARQSQSLAQETAGGLRRRAIRADDQAERLVRRRARPQPVAQAGIATRGIALAVDALIAQLVFLTLAATVGLIGSLAGGPDSDWVVGIAAAAGWLVVVTAYFTAFWTGAGQTPGMRLMRLRLLTASGSPPGLLRSLVRLFGLGVAIAIVFLGFVPALFDDRRRALQDFLAGTTVVYEENAPL